MRRQQATLHGAAGDEAREGIMARSMWRGAIQFGLVTIPVRLYLATDSKGIAFNMLHASCLNRIQMKTYCPFHDEVISRGDTVKGFEYARDQYVVITDEDLASVPLKTVRSIEIEKFIPAQPAQDDPVRFVKQAYYVEPEPIGRKAYALLREVLAEQGLAAICKVVIKDREALAALNPYANAMVLETLHWPDEIRATDELDLPAGDVEIKPAERAMAAQLISAMTGAFDPAEYRDEYRQALEAVIEAKVEGREIAEPDEAPAGGQLVDLMAALEASVNAARAARANRDEEAAAEEAAAGRSQVTTRRPKRGARADEETDLVEAEARKPARRKSA
ncbi:MAG: Ku protein [Candidatus Limnocylindrales bacterium]|jgi:DNA end-binding protein Ku|nr:Ku protein [Candidatus Limnocylindrales bacterium]